jgi:hypothetical protein
VYYERKLKELELARINAKIVSSENFNYNLMLIKYEANLAESRRKIRGLTDRYSPVNWMEYEKRKWAEIQVENAEEIEERSDHYDK